MKNLDEKFRLYSTSLQNNISNFRFTKLQVNQVCTHVLPVAPEFTNVLQNLIAFIWSVGVKSRFIQGLYNRGLGLYQTRQEICNVALAFKLSNFLVFRLGLC